MLDHGARLHPCTEPPTFAIVVLRYGSVTPGDLPVRPSHRLPRTPRFVRRPAAILTALIIAVVVVTGTYGAGARTVRHPERPRPGPVRTGHGGGQPRCPRGQPGRAQRRAAGARGEPPGRAGSPRRRPAGRGRGRGAGGGGPARDRADDRPAGQAPRDDAAGGDRGLRPAGVVVDVRGARVRVRLRRGRAPGAPEPAHQPRRRPDRRDPHRAGRAAGPAPHRHGRPGTGRAQAGRGDRAARQGPGRRGAAAAASWAR